MKIGTIGSGVIVLQFLEACQKVEGVELVGAYSRSLETALTIAKTVNMPLTFTDLNVMLGSTEIDTVYIASPNSLHYEQAKAVLNAGKHAIVEKPFCSHNREAEELIQLAQKNNCFIFEAMSINFMPNLVELKHRMHEIEPIKWVELSMCQYSSKFDAFKKGELPNVFNPEFSGGALMDLNIYHYNFILELFGKAESEHYEVMHATNGIDVGGVILMRYPNLMVTALATKDAAGRPMGTLHGEKGMIEFTEGVNGLRSFTLTQGKVSEKINIQSEDNRLFYEVLAFETMIKNKDKDAMLRLANKTIERLEGLTHLRKAAHIQFAADSKA